MSLPGFSAWLMATPLWLIALSLTAAMTVASLAGNLLHTHGRWRTTAGQGRDEPPGSFMLAPALGLLALLLGFTFALAVDRFDTRRALVLQEANAIGTTYLRAQLLQEPHRSKISQLLVAYTDNRLEIARLPSARARRLVARNDKLATQLWIDTVAAWPTMRDLHLSASFIDSMNAVIDLNESRKVSRQARVPTEVYVVLFIYLVATAGLVGFTRKSTRERWSALFLFLLLTLTLMLILDIDRPVGGGINESQLPMEDLQTFLHSSPPAMFGQPSGPH